MPSGLLDGVLFHDRSEASQAAAKCVDPVNTTSCIRDYSDAELCIYRVNTISKGSAEFTSRRARAIERHPVHSVRRPAPCQVSCVTASAIDIRAEV